MQPCGVERVHLLSGGAPTAGLGGIALRSACAFGVACIQRPRLVTNLDGRSLCLVVLLGQGGILGVTTAEGAELPIVPATRQGLASETNPSARLEVGQRSRCQQILVSDGRTMSCFSGVPQLVISCVVGVSGPPEKNTVAHGQRGDSSFNGTTLTPTPFGEPHFAMALAPCIHVRSSETAHAPNVGPTMRASCGA